MQNSVLNKDRQPALQVGHTKNGGGQNTAQSDYNRASGNLHSTKALLEEVTVVLDSLDEPANWPARPVVDEKSIRNTAFAPDPGGRSRGLDVIIDHHKQIFHHAYGALEAKLRSYVSLLESSRSGLDELRKRQAPLEQTPPKIQVISNDLPWGIWDRCKIALILLFSFLYIIVDLNSVATTLQESGIASFQNPLRAWCFTAIPLSIAVCLKLLRESLNEVNRRLHARCVTSLAIVSGFVWLFFFSTTFPNIARSPSEILGSLSLDAPLVTSEHSNNWLVFFGLTAAMAAAAASWIAVECIVEAHRTQKHIDNPDYQAKQREVTDLEVTRDRQVMTIERTRSFLERIENDCQDFLAEAQNVFDEADAAVAYSRDALIKFKNLPLILLAALLAGFSSVPVSAVAQPSTAAHRLFIVAVSPYLPKSDREVGYRDTVRLILDGLAPSDRLILLDGIRLDVATQLTIPEGEVFRKNPNARLRACARELAALRQFFATDVAHPPEMDGVVQVPQVLALCASHLRNSTQPITVIVFGSPFYADVDGAFNMLGGYVPSDQHLRVTTRQSVYGTADKASALEGVTVHYAYLHEAFEHAEHREAVARLWSLFVQCQQGPLASFAASPAIVFQRAAMGVQDAVMHVKLDEGDRELIRRRIKHLPFETWTTKTNEIPVASALKRQPSIEIAPTYRTSPITTKAPTQIQNPDAIPPTTQTNSAPHQGTPSPKPTSELFAVPESRTSIWLPTNSTVVVPTNSEIVTRLIPDTMQAGKNGIAIVWSVGGQSHQGVDVDLYVRPPKEAVELSFRNKESPVGRHLRDIVNAGGEAVYSKDPITTFEYVELDRDVLLRDTSMWLDLFRNDSNQAVEGLAIVVTKGRIFQKTFRFPPALCGDRGSQATHREENPNWLRVDLNRLLNHP